MPEKLRVGIVGVGGAASQHVPGWHASDDAELVAGCDNDAPALARWGAENGIDELEACDRPRGGISALREPQAARAVLARVFREALELPQEAWEPGRGVLLEADALAVLTRAMEEGQEELERALAALA